MKLFILSFIVFIIVNALSITYVHYMKYAELKMMIHVSIKPAHNGDFRVMISCDHP